MNITLHETRHGVGGTIAELSDGTRLPPQRLPIYGTARILLAQGYAPETPLSFSHFLGSCIAVRGTIGELAKWTVHEANVGSKRRQKYESFPTGLHDADSRRMGAPENSREGIAGYSDTSDATSALYGSHGS